MSFKPHPPIPGMPGTKIPLEAATDVGQEAFTDQAETVCSLGLWTRVNNRRRVCGLPPLDRDKRSAKELAAGLLEMRLFWVKGEDWDQEQPGDDPALVRFLSWIDYPMPRTVLARISYEGIAVPQEMRIPKMDLDRAEFLSDNYYYPKHKTTTKACVLQTRESDATATFQVVQDNGLVIGQVVDIMWRIPAGYATNLILGMPRGGSKNQTTVVSIEGSNVTFSGGTGDVFPTVHTKCHIMTDPDDVVKIIIWRLDCSPTCAGVARVCDRMKYTGTAREFNYENDPRLLIEYQQENAGCTQAIGNTVNQWFNPIVGYGASPPESGVPNFAKYANRRHRALTWKTFSGLQTGYSLRAILRENNPGIGDFQNYIWSIVPLSGVTVTGLTWPGIQYGTEQFDERSFAYWSPVGNAQLSASVNASVTSLPIVSASMLPLDGSYRLQIDDEIVLMSSTTTPTVGSPTVTVTRGYAGTTAAAHASGATVQFVDITNQPDLDGSSENWDSPNSSDLPFPVSWMRDNINAGLAEYALAGLGDGYALSENTPATEVIPFVVDGTWLCPSGVTSIVVLAWGPGGGGGEIGGGGGGGFSRKAVSVFPGRTYTIIVPPGGAGSSTGQGATGGDCEYRDPVESSNNVKAKGGQGGCSSTNGGIARGGISTGGLGSSRYNGGTGSTQGAGGASGTDSSGNNAVGQIAGKSVGYAEFASGQGGDSLQSATSPGGGGAATQDGGNGKVILIVNYANTNAGYGACPDWSVYSMDMDSAYGTRATSGYNQPYIGNDWPITRPLKVKSFASLPYYWVPQDVENCNFRDVNGEGNSTGVYVSGCSYVIGSGIIFKTYPDIGDYSLVLTSAENTNRGTFLAPIWNQEIEHQKENFIVEPGGGSLPTIDPWAYFETQEALLIGPSYQQLHVDEIVADEDNLMRVMCGMGPSPLTAELNIGWTNALVEYNIMGGVGYPISLDIIHEFRERRASVGVSGSGITDFEFVKDAYSEYGAEVYVWRRRFSQKTTKRVGSNILEESVQEYKSFNSLAWLGGITLNSGSTDEEMTMITWDSLEATADVTIEDYTMENSVVVWDNSTIAAGVPNFEEITENTPTNYVTNLASITPGAIYSVNTNFTDYYVPFIKYNFGDTNVGHEDNDGLPVGERQDAQIR